MTNKSSGISHPLAALILYISSSVATASVMWQPVGVSTTMGQFSTSFDVEELISQTGLSTPYVSGVTDASSYLSTHTNPLDEWQSTLNVTTGFVSFDLGSVVGVDGFRLWNSSYTAGPGATDVNQFTLFADNDFDPTNGLGVSLGTFNATNTGGSHPMQSFNFGTTSTQYVQMQIQSNHGSIGSGFSEGAFTVAVPEPSILALLGISLAGIGFARKRVAT